MPNNLISFDIWKTLFKPNSSFGDVRAQVVADFYGLPIDGKAFRAFIKSACADLDAATDLTGVQYGFASRIRLALERYGAPVKDVTDQDLATIYADIRKLQLSSIGNMPSLMEADLRDVFRGLVAAGMQLAVVSNTGMTEGAELTEILAAHGLDQHLTYRIYSDEVGSAKPGPEIFAELTRRSGIASHKILHVGDNIKADLEGAQRAGLNGRLYDPALKHPDNVWRYDTHRSLLG